MHSYNALLTIILIKIAATQQNYSCKYDYSLDISDGVNISNVIIKSDIRYTPEKYDINEDKTTGCVCDIMTCLKKCCAEEQYMADKDQCNSTQANFSSALVDIVPRNYFIINKPCTGEHETILLDPASNIEDAFQINVNGVLVMKDTGEMYEDYCVDFIEETDIVRALICINVEGSGQNIRQETIGKLYYILLMPII